MDLKYELIKIISVYNMLEEFMEEYHVNSLNDARSWQLVEFIKSNINLPTKKSIEKYISNSSYDTQLLEFQKNLEAIEHLFKQGRRKAAEWIIMDAEKVTNVSYKCSRCGCSFELMGNQLTMGFGNYCEHCGAKMDKTAAEKWLHE